MECTTKMKKDIDYKMEMAISESIKENVPISKQFDSIREILNKIHENATAKFNSNAAFGNYFDVMLNNVKIGLIEYYPTLMKYTFQLWVNEIAMNHLENTFITCPHGCVTIFENDNKHINIMVFDAVGNESATIAIDMDSEIECVNEWFKNLCSLTHCDFFKMNHDKYRDWAQLSVKAEHYTKSTSYCISVFDKPSRNYAVRAWMNEGIIEWMVNQFHNFKIKYNKQF